MTGAPRDHRFDQLIYEARGSAVWITLNRPQVRNALSIQLSDELIQALHRVRASQELKAVVLRDAVGGGLELTMACDFVIATESAEWGMPEVDVGITPGWGGTTRMCRLIGRRRTKEINLLGALHPARRAVEWNLWNRVVADDDLETEVGRLLRVLEVKNQQAMRQLKFIVNRGAEADLHTAQGFEELSAGLTGAVNGAWHVDDADRGAGVEGFVEKAEIWRRRRSLASDFWTY